jgi:hypothetical protein
MLKLLHSQDGSINLLALVAAVAGLTAVLFNTESIQISLKAKEIHKQLAISNAQQTNLAAISFLHACLEDGRASASALKIQDSKIIGSGNRLISASNGVAFYRQPNLSAANYEEKRKAFSGTLKMDDLPISDQTRLEILETKITGEHSKSHIIAATTTARYGDAIFDSVKTIGRIEVNNVPKDPPQDGQEEIPDCDRCLARAKELTATLGYVANINKTVNFGFYKVHPSTKLCDIHFPKNMRDRIEDHDGRTSVLRTQVAVYCPCNCGWAR